MVILAAVSGKRVPSPVLEVAHDLAMTYGDELVALNVLPEDEFDDHMREIRQLDEFADFSFTQEERKVAMIAKRVVTETIGEFDDERMSTVGRIGQPASEIRQVADEVDARYVVIGGRKRSPTGKAIFGSTTQTVLLNADRPIVTVIGKQ